MGPEKQLDGSRAGALEAGFRSLSENKVTQRMMYCSHEKNENQPFFVHARSH